MKKILTLTLITLLNLSLNAQSLLPIKYGIKAGANIANVTSIPNSGVENINSSSLIGIAGGLYMEVPVNEKWYLNPEIIYIQKGAAFTYSYIHDYGINQRDLHNTSHELKLDYIELNSTISYKTANKLSLNFGPSFSYLATINYTILSDIGEDSNEASSHELLPDGEYEEETLDISLNLGMSYYLTEDFLIDGRVNTGLISIGKVSKEIYTGSPGNDTKLNIYDLKNKGIVFSIAYLF
ncbi:MAG: porin family protein [Bacteroidota bacterium]|nr:porin family protein [Bacteroidota bacterium]